MDNTRVSESTSGQEGQDAEVSRPILEAETIAADNVELEAVPTIEGQLAVADALAAIRFRSFSGRRPELGKMVKDQITGRRVRQSEARTVQVFAKRWTVVDGKKVYTEEQLIAGETPETKYDTTVEKDIPAKAARLLFGAAPYKGKRRNPPKNKKQLQYVQIVRSLTPDEYTEEDLNKARKKAARSLGMAKKKTYGFMPKKVKNGSLSTTPGRTQAQIGDGSVPGQTQTATVGN